MNTTQEIYKRGLRCKNRGQFCLYCNDKLDCENYIKSNEENAEDKMKNQITHK